MGEGKTEREPERSGARPRHHEGFLMRAGYGLGYVSWTVNNASNKLELSGFTREWQVLLGGGGKGFIWGAVLAGTSGNLDYTEARPAALPPEPGEFKGEAQLSMLRYGGFVQYYPWITRGLHFQGQLVLFGADATGMSTSLNASSFGLTLGAGYDFWFADHWSAGLIASGTYLMADSDSSSEGALAPTLSGTITWN
jgi:hypothetical protein